MAEGTSSSHGNWEFLTFSIHIHSRLEKQWVQQGKDPRAMMRDRLRRELDEHVGYGIEHFFVIEGWSKLAKAPTRLHIHGGVSLHEGTSRRKIMMAAGRAAGHGIKGYPREPRAVHSDMFYRHGPAYINYLFKSVRRKDDRLNNRRVTRSRQLTALVRDFWVLITVGN